jgi:hypothetical protein
VRCSSSCRRPLQCVFAPPPPRSSASSRPPPRGRDGRPAPPRSGVHVRLRPRRLHRGLGSGLDARGRLQRPLRSQGGDPRGPRPGQRRAPPRLHPARARRARARDVRRGARGVHADPRRVRGRRDARARHRPRRRPRPRPRRARVRPRPVPRDRVGSVGAPPALGAVPILPPPDAPSPSPTSSSSSVPALVPSNFCARHERATREPGSGVHAQTCFYHTDDETPVFKALLPSLVADLAVINRVRVELQRDLSFILGGGVRRRSRLPPSSPAARVPLRPGHAPGPPRRRELRRRVLLPEQRGHLSAESSERVG